MRFHVRWAHLRPVFLTFGLALFAVAGSAGARWG